MGKASFFRKFSVSTRNNLEKQRTTFEFSKKNISNQPTVRASRWELNTFDIGKSQNFFDIFQSVNTNQPGKAENNFRVFRKYFFQMNPGDVLVIGK